MKWSRRFALKVTGKLKSVFSLAALAALALGLSPSLAKAQEYLGKFTLPFEAQWGAAVLAPGDYTFEVASQSPHMVSLRDERGKTVLIVPFPTPEEKVSSNQSKLTLVDNGARYVVQSFEAVELGQTFEYSVAKAKMQTKQVAQKRGLMRQVPVSTSAP